MQRHTCMYIYMYVCVYIYISNYIHICVRMYIYNVWGVLSCIHCMMCFKVRPESLKSLDMLQKHAKAPFGFFRFFQRTRKCSITIHAHGKQIEVLSVHRLLKNTHRTSLWLIVLLQPSKSICVPGYCCAASDDPCEHTTIIL